MTTRCVCRCHAEALAQAAVAREAVSPGMQSALVNYYLTEAQHDPGADVDDVIEAAVASGCACLNNHTPALRERRIWGPRIVPRETVPMNSEGEE
jgi:hypothetical protein